MRRAPRALAAGALLLCLAGGWAQAAPPEDETGALFRAGMTALRAADGQAESGERDGLLDEAVTAFRAILHDRPELVRVRLELARAFYLKGEDRLARGHFERVLAGGPPAAVAANVRRYLAAIRERRRWTTHLGATVAGDSNIGSASDAETISLFGLPFRTDPDARPVSGTGVSVRGGGEYQHPLSPRLRLRLGADAARREYAGSRFDGTDIAAHAGPRRLFGPRAEASLLATASRRSAGGRPQSRGLGLRAEARQRLSPTVRADLWASWEDRVFAARSGYDGYDGPVTRLGLHMAWLPAPQALVEGAAGYDRERPKAKSRRNRTPWGRLGAAAMLPRGFTLGGSLELRRTRYAEGDRYDLSRLLTPGGVPRRDLTRIWRLTGGNRGWTLFGFSPRLALVRESRETNAQLHDYSKTRLELLFHREF